MSQLIKGCSVLSGPPNLISFNYVGWRKGRGITEFMSYSALPSLARTQQFLLKMQSSSSTCRLVLLWARAVTLCYFPFAFWLFPKHNFVSWLHATGLACLLRRKDCFTLIDTQLWLFWHKHQIKSFKILEWEYTDSSDMAELRNIFYMRRGWKNQRVAEMCFNCSKSCLCESACL